MQMIFIGAGNLQTLISWKYVGEMFMTERHKVHFLTHNSLI